MFETYDEKIARVRLMAQQPLTLSPNDREALIAVIQYYDAFETVVRAALALAPYESFDEELSPGEQLNAPANPTAMNVARLTLHEALQHEACQDLAR